jgi:short-subunit dehydrogenase
VVPILIGWISTSGRKRRAGEAPVRRRSQARRRYDGTVAVVTGASSGIGRQLCVDLANRGAVVVGIARRRPLLDALQDELLGASPESRTRVCDVADTAAYEAALAATESEHGRIDVLVNNAGIEEPTPAEAGFTDAYRRLFDVNFFGLVAGTLAVLPGMLRRGTGIVVNVSSDSARAPEAASAAYAASKAAISAFTESIAHEVADRGVSVHVLYPAWVPTAMGMSGIEDGMPLPPKAVRRTEAEVSALVLERMGGPRMEINAALLPMLAPIGRSLAPVPYQKAMRSRASRAGPRG